LTGNGQYGNSQGRGSRIRILSIQVTGATVENRKPSEKRETAAVCQARRTQSRVRDRDARGVLPGRLLPYTIVLFI